MDMFGKADLNGNGLVEFDEFGALWEQLAPPDQALPPADDLPPPGPPPPPAEASSPLWQKFTEFDVDGDGALSREEVTALVVSLGYAVDDDYVSQVRVARRLLVKT